MSIKKVPAPVARPEVHEAVADAKDAAPSHPPERVLPRSVAPPVRDDRQLYLAIVTRRLVGFTALLLVVIASCVYWAPTGQRSFLALIVFGAGLVGGFVSLQQRLPKTPASDLRRLSESWFAIFLVPINGGIFALVLHLAFLGNIVQGALFPTYSVGAASPTADAAAVVDWMRNIAPANPTELGKLIFWAFVAGFSERLVPQILQDRERSATTAAQESRSKRGRQERPDEPAPNEAEDVSR